MDNWVGDHDGLQGPDLMERMKEHALRFNTEIINDHITSVDFSKRPFKLQGGDTTYTADAVIISTGATAQYLGLDSEEAFKGKGVSACATCDGFFYRGQKVAVIGGGDGANRWYHVVVREGRKREVRRLWEALDFKVSRLIRTRFSDIRMPDNLRANQSELLKPKQVQALLNAVKLKG